MQSNNSSRASEPALASRATKLTAYCCQFASTGCASHRENLSCCLSWSRLLPQLKEPTAKCFQGVGFSKFSRPTDAPSYQHSLSELIFQLSNFAQRAFFFLLWFRVQFFNIQKQLPHTLNFPLFHLEPKKKKMHLPARLTPYSQARRDGEHRGGKGG